MYSNFLKRCSCLRIIVMALALSLLAIAVDTAAADVVNYDCPDEWDSYKCDYTHEVGKLVTHEFRGKCAGEPLNAEWQKQVCHAGSSSVTCTDTFYTASYASCSCTNWDVTNSHKADIDINCDIDGVGGKGSPKKKP